MKRTLLALWAAAVLAALGLGAGSAQAYRGEREWRDDNGSAYDRRAVDRERRSARNSRWATGRVARAFDDDSDGPRIDRKSTRLNSSH